MLVSLFYPNLRGAPLLLLVPLLLFSLNFAQNVRHGKLSVLTHIVLNASLEVERATFDLLMKGSMDSIGKLSGNPCTRNNRTDLNKLMMWFCVFCMFDG